MKAGKPTIYIQNNTNQTLPVNLFLLNAPANRNNQNGATWNVCSQIFSQLTTVSIQARPTGSGSFTAHTAAITTQSLAGVLSALNSLNIGDFVSADVSGTTFIVAYSNSFEYNNLTINDSAAGTQVSFAWEFINLTSQSFLEFAVVDDTTFTLLFDISGPPGPGTTSGNATSFPNPVSKGDTVRFSAQWGQDKNGTAELFINGCLNQSADFTLVASMDFSVIFDRNEDEYSMVITFSS